MTTNSTELELGPYVTNQFGDGYFHKLNSNTFSIERAEALYKKYYPECFLEEDQLNFLIGTDSGLFVKHLKKQDLPKNSKYVFIEIQEVISQLEQLGQLDDLPEQIIVLNYDELWDKQDEFQFSSYVYIRNVLIAKSFCVLDGHLDIYRELETVLTMEFENKIWSLISNTGLSPFIERSFQNLCENRFETAVLKDIFKGKTAVLLGGGPSLDSFIPWIKDNCEDVVIITVSRVCRQLVTAGIKPHIIVSVDHQDINFDISKDMLSFSNNSFFINGHHVSELLLSQWSGNCTFLGPRFPWENPYLNGNLDLSGPTVTNSALTIAVFLGFEKVILGGVDFCFSQNGYTHARGSDERKAGPVLRSTLTVETNKGGTADTSADYYNAMLVMDGQAGRAKEAGCQVINCADSAARMENVIYIPIDDVIFEKLDNDPVDMIKELVPLSSTKDRLAHYGMVLIELQKIRKKMIKFKQLTKDALKCNDGLFGRKGLTADYKYKIQMDKIERKLGKSFTDLYGLVKNYSLKNFLQITRADSEAEWSDKEVERIGHDYYKACKDSVTELLRHTQDAIIRTKMRMEEEKEVPGFGGVLIDYWRQEKQPGRVRVWKNRNPDKWNELGEEIKNRLVEVDEEFEKKLQETETSNLKLRKKFTSLKGVSSIAIRYFKAHDEKGLERLLEGLENHPDKENSRRIGDFISGLQCELKSDSEKALEHYQKITGDEPNILTEETLLRILKITLNNADLDNAKIVAECLANISVAYLPYLAKIYELFRDKSAALDIYTDYLEETGYDTSVMLKMGQLYIDLGVPEGAKLMVKKVLEIDSDNKNAQDMLLKLEE